MREWPSLIGQTFEKLEVIAQAESSPKGQRRWVCRCECGNIRIMTTQNVKRNKSCGCSHFIDLTKRHIGHLTVLERSDRYASRGKRKVQLWKCLCDCGAIVYKATDTLTNEDENSCQACANKYTAEKMREAAGYVCGTQISKIKNISGESSNASGVRGVYFDKKHGRWRAQIKFQGVKHYLGEYKNLSEAIAARKKGEEKYFGTFLASLNEQDGNG